MPGTCEMKPYCDALFPFPESSVVVPLIVSSNE
jgi:hypothetical protein